MPRTVDRLIDRSPQGAPKIPKEEQVIYVPGRLGFDSPHDRIGGKALVTSVIEGYSAKGDLIHWVYVRERPGTRYNWELLLANDQRKLRKLYKEKWAEPDTTGRSYKLI